MTEPRIYLDANVFIYAVEGGPDIASIVRPLFDREGLSGLIKEPS